MKIILNIIRNLILIIGVILISDQQYAYCQVQSIIRYEYCDSKCDRKFVFKEDSIFLLYKPNSSNLNDSLIVGRWKYWPIDSLHYLIKSRNAMNPDAFKLFKNENTKSTDSYKATVDFNPSGEGMLKIVTPNCKQYLKYEIDAFDADGHDYRYSISSDNPIIRLNHSLKLIWISIYPQPLYYLEFNNLYLGRTDFFIPCYIGEDKIGNVTITINDINDYDITEIYSPYGLMIFSEDKSVLSWQGIEFKLVNY